MRTRADVVKVFRWVVVKMAPNVYDNNKGYDGKAA